MSKVTVVIHKGIFNLLVKIGTHLTVSDVQHEVYYTHKVELEPKDIIKVIA
jgi:hypothetical protein